MKLLEDYSDVLTVAELQNVLGVGRSKAYQLVHEEVIKPIRVGKKILIPKLTVLRFLYGEEYNSSSCLRR